MVHFVGVLFRRQGGDEVDIRRHRGRLYMKSRIDHSVRLAAFPGLSPTVAHPQLHPPHPPPPPPHPLPPSLPLFIVREAA
jgi:hypothetical protein